MKIQQSHYFRFFSVVTICCYLSVSITVYGAGVSLLPQGTGNVREFYSSNPENRLSVRVHVWGDVGGTGIYYVPDNTTILDLMGYAGGPAGVLPKADINLTRINAGPDRPTRPYQTIRFNAEELIREDFRNLRVASGDVVYVEGVPKTDNLLRTLSIIGAVTGIISTSLTLYLILRK